MRTILCPTDLSTGADEALRQASALARLHGARLEPLLVIPSPLRSDPLFPRLYQRSVSELPQFVERAAAVLAERVAAVTGRGHDEFSTTVRDGVPYGVIVERAAEVLLGSVAESVARHAPCSVLAVRLREERDHAHA